jgi:hypothetical protein
MLLAGGHTQHAEIAKMAIKPSQRPAPRQPETKPIKPETPRQKPLETKPIKPGETKRKAK